MCRRDAVSDALLFCSGLFAGGAVDHSILALRGKQRTPYGFRAGVKGNSTFGALDGLLAVAAYLLYRLRSRES